MYEYKLIKLNNHALPKLWKEWWSLTTIFNDIMYFKRIIKQIRKTPPKEQIEEKLYYNENYIKGCCYYYKEIESLYKDWREQRKECNKFKPYTIRNEKITFNKISKYPKTIVEEMLNKAITWSWGRIIELEAYEIEKIMQPLREEKRKEEIKLEWFSNESEKQEAEKMKQEIEKVIKQNPQLEKEAKDHVINKFPTLTEQLQEKMIYTRIRLLARKLIDK